MNQSNQQYINQSIELQKEQFLLQMTNHNHRFVDDFNNLMSEQLRNFQPAEFDSFLKRFQTYQIRDDKNMEIDELRIFSTLMSETFKYDTLFLSKDQIPSDHPILKVPNLSIISEKEFTEALEHIETTNMVRVNRKSLLIHCLLHLRTKFLSTLSPNFYLQYIKGTQSKSKRDRNSPEKMKPTTATMADRSIRKSLEDEMQGVFGYGSSLWNSLIKVTSPKKKALQLPNYAIITGTTPIQINKSAKKEIVYASMVPLIRLLSPDYPIMTFEQWCISTDDDDLSTYRKQYLNKRVKLFDRLGILFSVT
jgi:hypothetical protein